MESSFGRLCSIMFSILFILDDFSMLNVQLNVLSLELPSNTLSKNTNTRKLHISINVYDLFFHFPSSPKITYRTPLMNKYQASALPTSRTTNSGEWGIKK